MSPSPTLLFLHGVTHADPSDKWRTTLDESLKRVGYAGLTGLDVIAPSFKYALQGVDDDIAIPAVTVRLPRGDRGKAHRRDFERRRAAMEARLQREAPGHGLPGVEPLFGLVAMQIEAVDNYVRNPRVRAVVLQRILSRLPSEGRLVIIGHSLGSVIAADLIRRLPVGLDVTGVLSIGSPLGHPSVHVDGLQALLEDPPANLGWWVNFRAAGDVVPAGRGLCSVFPWVLDQRIRDFNPLPAHFAATYMKDHGVATAVGFAAYGSLSTELVPSSSGVEIVLDFAETFSLLALRYAHLTLRELDGDAKDRFAEALRRAQAETVEHIRRRNDRTGRPTPGLIARLGVDLTDPFSQAPEPVISGHLEAGDAVVLLLAILEANVVAPYEIEVGKDPRRMAMENLTLEMGFGTSFGTAVFEAIEEAQRALKGETNKMKWVALGMGSAALLVATGGLALAAAPGVAGAAAITSALAAFGPGGMIGGLLTAGTLLSAGGGGVAVGLAAPGTTAETVEAVVAAQLSAAILRSLRNLDQDPQTWANLVETEIEVRREIGRLEHISDKSAPSLKAARRKLETLELAIGYLDRENLRPAAVALEAPLA